MIAVGVLYATSEPKVVRNFLIACAVADVGHVYACYHVMGLESFADVANWSGVVWGNVGITSGLFLARALYLAGFLGKDRIVYSTRKKI